MSEPNGNFRVVSVAVMTKDKTSEDALKRFNTFIKTVETPEPRLNYTLDHYFLFIEDEEDGYVYDTDGKGKDMIMDFEIPGLPFAVLAEKSGLVAWRGHPDDRELNDDLNELMRGHMLFETEDFHDDPDQARKDPDEVEMQKDLDLQNRKPKPLNEAFDEIQ